jgi:hypothetical protein
MLASVETGVETFAAVLVGTLTGLNLAKTKVSGIKKINKSGSDKIGFLKVFFIRR